MPQLNEIVDVEITREARGVTRVGFNTPLILAGHSAFTGEVREYSSLQEMLDDGFTTSDAAYKAAAALVAQDDAPDSFKVGNVSAAVAQVTTVTPNVSSQTVQHYIQTINGVDYDFTSDASPTAAEVVTGLAALINAGTEPVTASGSTTLILTADVAGTAFTHAESANLTAVATTPNNGAGEDILAADELDSDWYALIHSARSKAAILQAAAQIETMERIYIPVSEDADVIAGTADNVADTLHTLAYDRTAYLYSGDQENFPEAAWIGTRLALDPGSATWKFPTLKGITPDKLSTNQSNNVREEYGNVYETFAGRSIVREGTVASGEYLDVIIGVDYLRARIREDVFDTLANAKKVPYTDAGVATIENVLRARLQDGIAKGILADFTVTVPKVKDIPIEDRQARLLPDIEFDGTLAGAIHKVKIRGRVSV